MGYERRIWVNNQTKLNATNLNHIEAGLEGVSNDLDSAEEKITDLQNKIPAIELASTTAAAQATQAADLASSANVIAESALQEAERKQDTLISGTTIKTINNESLLGEGNIEFYNKSEVEALIDSKIDTAIVGALDKEY